MITIACSQCGTALQLYTPADAAEYLGISPSGVKYHLHVSGNLKPVRVGNILLLTQAELDRFQSTRRPAGRPRITKES